MKSCSEIFSRALGLPVLCLALGSTQAAAVSSGTVSTIVGVNAGLCMGVENSSNTHGAILQSQTCTGSNYQKWQITKDSANYAEIKNVGSGQCMDVSGWSSDEGTVLQQWDCTGADNQKWNISDQGNGKYAIISKFSDMAADVFELRKTSGTKIIQWPWNGLDNQKWTFPDATTASNGAMGFAAGVTGGQGGSVVTVTTPSQLKQYISDDTPRIIRVSGIIDFRNTEGSTTELGCTYSDNYCSNNGKREKILNHGGYCSGRSTYNITYDTAGATPLQVGSNKTLIGIGANSGIKGKGLRMSGGVSNIIIRNLSITDINDGTIWAGDALTMVGVSNIWIDHNYVARIGRQLIVTGWDSVQNLTISNNYLDGTSEYGHYCNNRHYWNELLVAENQTISFISNRVSMTSGRAPRFSKNSSASSAGVLHMVNNYFDHNYGTSFVGDNTGTVLMEGNYYEAADGYSIPIDSNSTGMPLFAPLDSSVGSTDSTCQSVLGRKCAANYAVDATGNFVTNSSAMSAIQQNSSWRNAIKSVTPKSYSEVKAQSFGPQSDITE